MSGTTGMKPDQMRPFIEGTVEVFESMLRVRLRESAVELKQGAEGTFDLSAVVGLTGAATGSFVLSSPLETACRIVERMLGEPGPLSEQDVVDGAGELVNIVAGRACRKLGGAGLEGLFLSLPTVVRGRHRIVWSSKDLPCLLMRFFDSELGPFAIEVNLRAGA